MNGDGGAGAGVGKEGARKLSSGQIDAKYVGRARHLFTGLFGLLDRYEDTAELAAMNHKKRGRPYRYPHSLMMAIATLRHALNLDFRSCEGMVEACAEGKAPDHSTICRRINSLDVSVMDGAGGGKKVISDPHFTIEVVPDGTGLTPARRSEYVRVVHKLRRGFVRLSILINKETLEIVSFAVTDDRTGEPAVFKDLLEDGLHNLGIDPDERRREVREGRVEGADSGRAHPRIVMTADGGYDTRRIFSICKELGITARIRVRTNSGCRARGVDRARSLAVLDQLGGENATPAKLAAMDDKEREANRKLWKERVNYGTRWLVEIVISAFKRKYGDSVRAKKMQNVIQEIRQKIRVYNDMLRVGGEAAMRA